MKKYLVGRSVRPEYYISDDKTLEEGKGGIMPYPEELKKLIDSIMPLITKYGMGLAEYQQDFMPLRIFIKPVKEVFKVDENTPDDLEKESKLLNAAKDVLGHDLDIINFHSK